MAKPFTQTLISAARNINLDPCDVRSADVTPGCKTAWSVRKMRLHGGKQEGVDLIVIDNGTTTLRVCPTRGMGIIDATAGDLRLGWDSPVKEIVHPAFINATQRGGTGWLDGFNEYLVRCGLEFFGPPCDDPHHLAVGEPPAGPITLHGKVANIPASEVELEVQTKAPHRITLRGVVNEVSMYGPKLRLTTEISTEPGAAAFTVTDTVTNLGGQEQEFGVLYHINHGKPLLEDGARFIAPIKHVCPRDADYDKSDVKHFDRYSGPRPGAPEQVFLFRLHGDKRGQTAVMLHNKPKDRGVEIGFPLQPLPCFTLWKGIHHADDAYVTGLEPSTCYPLPRPVEREAGRLMTLKPGKSWSAALSFTLHADKTAVRDAAKRIAKIAGDRKSNRSSTPGDIR